MRTMGGDLGWAGAKLERREQKVKGGDVGRVTLFLGLAERQSI